MPHYAGTRRSEYNPLRSLPFSRPAADVLHVPQAVMTVVEQNVSLWPTPSDDVLLQREFAAAEATLAISVDALASARLVVVDAKRTTTAPIVVNGRPAGGGRPIAPERVHERKLYARRLIRRRLAEMAVARGRVEQLRAQLGLPSLVELEERAATAKAVRESKCQPVTRADRIAAVAGE